MRILALVDLDALKRLRTALTPRYDICHVDAVSLSIRLAESEPRLLVVDPSHLRPDEFVHLMEMARSRQNVAVLVFAALTADTARAATAASLILPIEAAFFGAYDESDALARVCAKLLVPSVPALMLRGLAPTIGAMPRRLGTRVVGLFGGQPIPASTRLMLDGLGVSVDTAHDWLVAAGITKPHQLRACALLARAFPDLGLKEESLERIVERFGMPSVRALGRACHTLTSLSARRAGRLDEVECARRMLVALTSHV